MTRPGFPAALSNAHGYSPVAGILGSLLHSRWRMSDAGLVQIGGPVSDVPNDAAAVSTVHLTSSGASRPTHSATGLDGFHAAATGDGVANHLVATLAPAIASGARPYIFMVGKFTDVLASASKYLIALWQNQSSTEDGTGQVISLLFENTHGRWASDWRSSAALVQTLGGDADADVHVFEIGMTAGGVASLVVDRIGRDSTQTATINATMVGMQSHGLVLSGSDVLNSQLAEAELIVCSNEPSLSQKQLVAASLKNTYSIPTYPIGGVTRFDLSLVDASFTQTQNFIDGISDGVRYVYFPPGPHFNKFLRLDTQAQFNSVPAWSVKDITSVIGAQIGYYQGGCFDGRYIYMAPYGNAGRFARYDTQGAFASDASYSFFDLTGIDALGFGFVGAVWDGSRYVHVVPNNNNLPAHGLAFRYDTQGAFGSAGSYSTFDCTQKGAKCKGFAFGTFIGGYVYFGPWDAGDQGISGTILRYNTALNYTNPASWETFDATAVTANAKGFVGVTNDGRYVYFTPFNKTRGTGDNGTALRYDTTKAFDNSNGGYVAFDMTTMWKRAQGHMQAVWDGSRYLYYTPQETAGSAFGLAIRYDSQGAGFNQASSYKPIALEQIGDGLAAGFSGGAALGGVVYLAACQSKYAIKIERVAA